jgi:flagellar export protein FliJ
MAASRFAIVLDLRRQAEDAVKRELGALEGERAGLVAELDGLHRDLAGAQHDVPPQLREQLSAFGARMRHAIAGCTGRISGAEARIGECRGRLAAAHREVRAIEALIARERAEAGLRARRREGRDTDEFAARRWWGAAS